MRDIGNKRPASFATVCRPMRHSLQLKRWNLASQAPAETRRETARPQVRKQPMRGQGYFSLWRRWKLACHDPLTFTPMVRLYEIQLGVNVLDERASSVGSSICSLTPDLRFLCISRRGFGIPMTSDRAPSSRNI